MAESIFGDCLAQYRPGHESDEPQSKPTRPAFDLLAKSIDVDHPDFLALSRELMELHILGFDTKSLLKVRDAREQHVVDCTRRRQERATESSVVYYMRMRDLVKIGTTTSPVRVRQSQLMADEVLATEPGGYELEKKRHRQFDQYRYRGERFYPGPELLAHIATIQPPA
jgi:hypothetical protein